VRDLTVGATGAVRLRLRLNAPEMIVGD